MLAGRAVLSRLRAETADLHAAAEQLVRILDEGATLSDYERYLRAMHGFHALFEARFADHAGLAAAGFAARDRRKAVLAAADLAALGAVADARGPAVAASPAAAGDPALPATDDLMAALGAAYVLEGSTLGGRFVLARLPPALAPLRGRATAFLDGYGELTAPRWRAFGEVIERAVRTEADADAVVAGARATFASLVDWLRAT